MQYVIVVTDIVYNNDDGWIVYCWWYYVIGVTVVVCTSGDGCSVHYWWRL